MVTCGIDDEQPPPALLSIEEIGAMIAKQASAPYIDESTAEIKRMESEINAHKEEIERLETENKKLADRVDYYDSSTNMGDTESKAVTAVDRNSNDNSTDNLRRADRSTHQRRIIEAEATAYTARCEGCSGITSTGIDVRQSIYHAGKRIIAVDPSIIALGSHVKVTASDGSSFEATAQDVGGAIKGSRIDVLVGTKGEAIEFGRQSVSIEIIE